VRILLRKEHKNVSAKSQKIIESHRDINERFFTQINDFYLCFKIKF